jgi:hypothetical protein
MSLHSIYGRHVGYRLADRKLITHGLEFVDDRSPNSSWAPVSSPKFVSVFDDFTSTLTGWTLTEGTDSATSAAVVTTGLGGVLLMTTGDAGTGYAADAEQLTGPRAFSAEFGGLVFETRLKLSAITTCQVFLGFTDDATTLEIPIDSAASANTITTTATDAVGIFFDTDMTTDQWWAAGVANGTDATHFVLGSAPVADTYETFRIQVNSAGAADFFRNGLKIGSTMSGAVTPTVALCPVVTVSKLSVTASMTMSVDYIYAGCNRF